MPECFVRGDAPLRRSYLTQWPCLSAPKWLARRSMGLLASSRAVRRRPEATGARVVAKREHITSGIALRAAGIRRRPFQHQPPDKGHLIGAPFLWARGFVITFQVQLGCDPESHVPRYGNACYCTRHPAPEQSLNRNKRPIAHMVEIKVTRLMLPQRGRAVRERPARGNTFSSLTLDDARGLAWKP